MLSVDFVKFRTERQERTELFTAAQGVDYILLFFFRIVHALNLELFAVLGDPQQNPAATGFAKEQTVSQKFLGTSILADFASKSSHSMSWILEKSSCRFIGFLLFQALLVPVEQFTDAVFDFHLADFAEAGDGAAAAFAVIAIDFTICTSAVEHARIFCSVKAPLHRAMSTVSPSGRAGAEGCGKATIRCEALLKRVSSLVCNNAENASNTAKK